MGPANNVLIDIIADIKKHYDALCEDGPYNHQVGFGVILIKHKQYSLFKQLFKNSLSGELLDDVIDELSGDDGLDIVKFFWKYMSDETLHFDGLKSNDPNIQEFINRMMSDEENDSSDGSDEENDSSDDE